MIRDHRRGFLQGAGLALAMLLAPPMAAAQAAAYPSQPIRIVVPYGPGGIGDFTARALAKYLDAAFNTRVVVENKPGASGLIAMNWVKSVKPDGYTLVMTSNTTLSAARHLFKNLAYDPMKDFDHIAILGAFSSMALVPPGAPFKTIPQLVDYTGKNPGKVFYAYTNTSSQVPSEMLNNYAGIKMTGVAYKEPGQAVTDLVGGQTQFMFMDTVAARPFIQSGKLIPIAVAQPNRAADWPELPAMSEFYPGFGFIGYITVSAPAGTPAPVVAKLNEAMRQAVRDEGFRKQLETNGMTPRDYSPTELVKFIEDENQRWNEYARIARLEPN